MKQPIETALAPAAIGPYSQAIRVGNTIYFSGQIPLDPKTMNLVTGDFAKQATQVLNNLQAVSQAAGGSLEKVVKLTVYLMDFADFPIFNEVMKQFFQPPYPARTTVQVSALPKGARLEVEGVMVC